MTLILIWFGSIVAILALGLVDWEKAWNDFRN